MPTFFATSAQFRAWLKEHAAGETELIVGFHRRDSGLPSMTWQESVDEALCVGWIDGVRTRIDEHSYKIRFTPRKPTSTWSAINIDRVRVLQLEGRMQQAGLDAFARRTETKSGIYAYEQAKTAELAPADEAEFRKNKVAWEFFQAQAKGYRHLVAWQILSAKRPQTKRSRLLKLIEASARMQRL